MLHGDALRCYILNQKDQELNQALSNCMHFDAFCKKTFWWWSMVCTILYTTYKKHRKPIEITKPRSLNLEKENPLPEPKGPRHLGPHHSLVLRLHLLGVAHVHGRSYCYPCTFCDRQHRCEPPLRHCTSKPGPESKSMHASSIVWTWDQQASTNTTTKNNTAQRKTSSIRFNQSPTLPSTNQFHQKHPKANNFNVQRTQKDSKGINRLQNHSKSSNKKSWTAWYKCVETDRLWDAALLFAPVAFHGSATFHFSWPSEHRLGESHVMIIGRFWTAPSAARRLALWQVRSYGRTRDEKVGNWQVLIHSKQPCSKLWPAGSIPFAAPCNMTPVADQRFHRYHLPGI